MTEATSSVPAMREPLDGVTVHINRVPISASTTIGTIGAHALVLSTAIPGRGTTLTASYLARSDAAMAVSRLIANAGGERLHQRTLGPTDHHATFAGACLLDHAAALRELLAEQTYALVTADVDLTRSHPWPAAGAPSIASANYPAIVAACRVSATLLGVGTAELVRQGGDTTRAVARASLVERTQFDSKRMLGALHTERLR